MSSDPLVSVICLSHNHGSFVAEAIRSVRKQDYTNYELIVIDDGSNDESKHTIKDNLNLGDTFIDIRESIGNCKAFNLGFQQSKGEFIIDLAADDVLFPRRITYGIETFLKKNIGVEFCNVMMTDPSGKELGKHFKNTDAIVEGDIYIDLIKRYFISPPGMMIKREVLDELGGYDESLAYEDFDFWIRSSRNHQYGYTNEVLVTKRILPDSLSAKQFKFRNKYQKSTLAVCKKIKKLNRSKKEEIALKKRCTYEIKQCFRQWNFELVPGFLKLLN